MYYLGVDLGGTNIGIGLVNAEGKILQKTSIPTIRDRSFENMIEDIAQNCQNLIEKQGITKEDINSVGVGCPGLCDIENGILQYSNNLNYKNVNIRKEIQKYYDVPVYIENDANCAAFGEVICGAAVGRKNVILVTLGTGVGAGFYLDGKIFSGTNNGGGEAGHMVIVAEGEMCTCGRKGCWEAYASATALKREGRIAAAKYPNGEIFKLVEGNIKLIDAKTVFEAHAKGDEVAIGIIEQYIKYVAIGLVNLVNIFQPEAIVIGGGICAQGDVILKPVREILNDRVYGGKLLSEVLVAKLGSDAGIVGAALLDKNGSR